MDPQFLINCGFALAGVLAGWLFRVIWCLMEEQRKEIRELARQIGEVEKVVAGDYVKRADFDRSIDTLITKLDQIRDKLDSKADK